MNTDYFDFAAGMMRAQRRYDEQLPPEQPKSQEREQERIETELSAAMNAAVSNVQKGMAFEFDKSSVEVTEFGDGHRARLLLEVQRIECDGFEADNVGRVLIELGKQLLLIGNHPK